MKKSLKCCLGDLSEINGDKICGKRLEKFIYVKKSPFLSLRKSVGLIEAMFRKQLRAIHLTGNNVSCLI